MSVPQRKLVADAGVLPEEITQDFDGSPAKTIAVAANILEK